jgi:hypothetical protein
LPCHGRMEPYLLCANHSGVFPFLPSYPLVQKGHRSARPCLIPFASSFSFHDLATQLVLDIFRVDVVIDRLPTSSVDITIFIAIYIYTADVAVDTSSIDTNTTHHTHTPCGIRTQ